MNFADYGESKLPVITSELDRHFPSPITVQSCHCGMPTSFYPIIKAALRAEITRGGRIIVEIIKTTVSLSPGIICFSPFPF